MIEALENVVSFDVNRESITWSEFVALDIIGNKQRRLMVMRHLIWVMGMSKHFLND